MKKELRDRIIEYNKAVVENSKKASDLEIVVSSMKELPPGQLKKILTDEVIAVLSKYGIHFEKQEE